MSVDEKIEDILNVYGRAVLRKDIVINKGLFISQLKSLIAAEVTGERIKEAYYRWLSACDCADELAESRPERNDYIAAELRKLITGE